MKRSIIRPVIVAIAAAAALALAGCGTGINSQTSHEVAAVPGYNTTGDSRVGVRNALLTYPGPQGYKAGSDATIEMRLFNNTDDPVRVKITSSDGTVTPDALVTVPPQGLFSPTVKLTVQKDVTTAAPVQLTVEFVGIKQFTFPVNIVPPTAPAA